MASEDLLKKAVAAFNALSPEQQAEMLEEQRQSWVRGNVGLSRDERGMTPPVAPVSPDATGKCGELVTAKKELLQAVKFFDDFPPSIQSMHNIRVVDAAHKFVSQAEELLAAKGAAIKRWRSEYERAQSQNVELAGQLAKAEAEAERWHKKAMDAGVIVHSDGTTSHPMRKERDDLKADNAALTARVNFLERVWKKAESRAEALEAKLAAAELALKRADEALQLDATASGHTYVKIALGEVRS